MDHEKHQGHTTVLCRRQDPPPTKLRRRPHVLRCGSRRTLRLSYPTPSSGEEFQLGCDFQLPLLECQGNMTCQKRFVHDNDDTRLRFPAPPVLRFNDTSCVPTQGGVSGRGAQCALLAALHAGTTRLHSPGIGRVPDNTDVFDRSARALHGQLE